MPAADLDTRATGSDRLVAEIAEAFDLPTAVRWSDLGGSRTTNLRLDHPAGPLVCRIHQGHTSWGRLAAVQAARRAVASAGLPAVAPLATSDGRTIVRLASGRLAELESFVPWNGRMNTAALLETGFGVAARVHDVLRDSVLPAAAEEVVHANHVHAEDAAAATRRGAARIRAWSDPALGDLADRAVRHIEAVAAVEAALHANRDRQLVHGDFWDNNVLFRDGRLVALLDFDFMAVRPRIDDLALTAYFFLLEPGKGLPGAADRAQLRRFLARYDASASVPLSPDERAAVPAAIARQPAWSFGRWIVELDEPEAREHATHARDELPVAETILADLPLWQDALL